MLLLIEKRRLSPPSVSSYVNVEVGRVDSFFADIVVTAVVFSVTDCKDDVVINGPKSLLVTLTVIACSVVNVPSLTVTTPRYSLVLFPLFGSITPCGSSNDGPGRPPEPSNRLLLNESRPDVGLMENGGI